jgi:hypothetical protein
LSRTAGSNPGNEVFFLLHFRCFGLDLLRTDEKRRNKKDEEANLIKKIKKRYNVAQKNKRNCNIITRLLYFETLQLAIVVLFLETV